MNTTFKRKIILKFIMKFEHVLNGEFELTYGSMGCGKTEELITRVHKFPFFNVDFLFIKPSNDTRDYGYVMSRRFSGQETYICKMIPYDKPELIIPFVEEQKKLHPDLKTILFDEMQLWSKEPKNEFQIDHAVYELLLRD